MRLIYHDKESARAAMRTHLTAANRVLLRAGALPSVEVRNVIAGHLDEYENALQQFAELDAADRAMAAQVLRLTETGEVEYE